MKIPFLCDKVKVTSAFGYRRLGTEMENHRGYDLVGVGSTDVCAVVGGVVATSAIVTDKNNLTWQWGNFVKVRGEDGRDYFYCHLASRAVKKGQTVKAGDKLGVMGNTGYSFGAHLHLEVREGGKSISPESVTGIPNKVGIYTAPKKSQLELDLDVLVAHGVIKTPEYWLKTAPRVQYLPELIHNMEEVLKSCK